MRNAALDVRELPKVQLHCHLEGTIAPQTFRELARKHAIDLGLRGSANDSQLYAFADFHEFLLLFRDVSATLREPSDFGRLAHEYACDAAAHHVTYAEVFVSPSVWTFFQPELDVRATVAAIRVAFDDAARTRGAPEIALICDVTRNFGPERALRTARLAASLRPYGVIGIGLGGDELNFPPTLFADAFAYAADAGLHRVVHAGEAAGAPSVRDAVEVLGAERIGHGVRALEDPAVVALLAKRQIPLEICPTSNFLTGAAARDALHPLVALDAAGVRCTIDADDPALFGTTVTDEFALVRDWLGDAAVVRLAANAVDASFASAACKTRSQARLDAYVATLGLISTAARRSFR